MDGAGAAAALAAAVEESAGYDDDDDDTPLMHHARAWQAAAEASSPVSTLETGAARKAEAEANIAADMETASESEYGSVEGSLLQEISPAPARAKPSSAAPDSSSPPQGHGSSQVASLTMPMLPCNALVCTHNIYHLVQHASN